MTHQDLVEMAAQWLSVEKRCPIVLPEFRALGEEVPDVIGFFDDGASILIECKASLVDFKSDCHKSYRTKFEDMEDAEDELSDNGMGNYRYYFVHEDLLSTKDKILTGWGLLETDGFDIKETIEAKYFCNAKKRNELKLLTNAIRRLGIVITPSDVYASRKKRNTKRPNYYSYNKSRGVF